MDELSRINDWSTVAREVARRGTSAVPPQPSASQPSSLHEQSQLTAALATELERSPAAVVSIRVELMGQGAERAAEQRSAQQRASERAAGDQNTALTRRAQPQQAFRTAQAPRIVIVDSPAPAEEISSEKLPQLNAYAGPSAYGSASSQPTAAERFASFGGERAVAAYAQQRSWVDAPQRQLLDLRA